MSTQLQPKEQARFELLEKVCKEGRAVFFIVGSALSEIKLNGYYKAKGFDEWDDYCESIGYSKRYANQLVADSKVIDSLPEPLRKLVQSEQAARALAKLPPLLRAPVAEKASAGGKKTITSTAVKKNSPPPRKPTAPLPKASMPKKPSPKNTILDETGIEVPQELLAFWNRRLEAQENVTYAKAIRSRIIRVSNGKDPLYAEMNFQSVFSSLNQVVEDLKTAIPWAVCPSCSGITKDGCIECKGRGFVSEFHWNTCVPEEKKALRKK